MKVNAATYIDYYATNMTKAPEAPSDTPRLAPEAPVDTVELSAQGLEKERIAKVEPASQDVGILQKQMEQIREQSEDAAEGWKIYIKCLRIAMRIISGDNVPEIDHQYLAKNDPELYGKAMSMKVHKQDPEDLDSISDEDDDKKSGSEDEDGAAEGLASASMGAVDFGGADIGAAEAPSPEGSGDGGVE